MNIKHTLINLTEFNLNKNYVHFKNDAIGKWIVELGSWEPHITELMVTYIKNGDNCLDIGSNFGYHSITMSMLVGESGKTFSFEPMKAFYHLILANSHLNNLDNLFVFNKAVGKENTSVYIQEPNVDTSYIINHGDTSITTIQTGRKVEMVTIDTLDLPKIKFIKLDVQGHELMVLQGAKNKILHDKPFMIIEMEPHQVSKFGYTIEELITFIIIELKYDVYQMVTAYPFDFLCVPKNNKIDTTFETFKLIQIFLTKS